MSAVRKRKSKTLLWISLIVLLAAAFILYRTLGPNTGSLSKGEYLYIHTGWTYNDVQKELQRGGYIKDATSFSLLSKLAKLPEHVHAGKYKISPGMSNYNIVRMLRSGRQTPVRLVINKLRTKEDFIKLVSANLEADSNQLRKLLSDAGFLSSYHLDSNTAMCAVMPDTYEFFWNTTAENAFKKIAKKYTSYWNNERRQKAVNKNLTPQQVITIASILEEETNANDEKPNIASVYLNRLKTGVRLQADPTIKYAIGDFTIRRVNSTHLAFISPYNTYINAGLPPGPICTPSKASIEAVLNAPDTKLMYFCASPAFNGHHVFAETMADHLKNAKAYQQALNERGIH
jgi:UPF0755 protein